MHHTVDRMTEVWEERFGMIDAGCLLPEEIPGYDAWGWELEEGEVGEPEVKQEDD